MNAIFLVVLSLVSSGRIPCIRPDGLVERHHPEQYCHSRYLGPDGCVPCK